MRNAIYLVFVLQFVSVLFWKVRSLLNSMEHIDRWWWWKWDEKKRVISQDLYFRCFHSNYRNSERIQTKALPITTRKQVLQIFTHERNENSSHTSTHSWIWRFEMFDDSLAVSNTAVPLFRIVIIEFYFRPDKFVAHNCIEYDLCFNWFKLICWMQSLLNIVASAFFICGLRRSVRCDYAGSNFKYRQQGNLEWGTLIDIFCWRFFYSSATSLYLLCFFFFFFSRPPFSSSSRFYIIPSIIWSDRPNKRTCQSPN